MIIAYDLGTGGIKASLFNGEGMSLADSFIPYPTYYPHERRHEQRPLDWWDGVCRSTRILLEQTRTDPEAIACIALSGHSLVVAPLDREGRLLAEQVPIWSDTRATDCVGDFFAGLTYDDWYMTTGNGDPTECYSILKLMWMKKHQPELFSRTDRVLGSKDFINYRLTGVMCTDPSYASGFGVFNLLKWDYEDRFFEAAGIPREIFPEIVPSDAIIGHVTAEAAAETGLAEGTPVACGAVDNTCMALGARGLREGGVYTSLGSSSWIAVTSQKPVLDLQTKPFIFAHVQKGYYTSAVSIFSAGNSFRWIRDTLCKDHPDYHHMNELAAAVPPGSNGVLFNPTLAGGSTQEPSPYLQGGFMGLTLATTQADLIRAAMEGVAMALRETLDILKTIVPMENEMLICGGGSKSRLWMQIFADIFEMNIIKTNIDQNTASLGAAALAANAVGLWKGYDRIEALHRMESITEPDLSHVKIYTYLQPVFRKWTAGLAELGNEMQKLSIHF